MSKIFSEVFPTLVLEESIRQQLEQVAVEKVTTTSRKDFLRVYICSSHLISKEIILKLEREIKAQLFPKTAIAIKIYEKFQLSAQYTPEKFWDVYWESVLLELKEYDHILYNAAKGADIVFEADRMALTVQDTVLVRGKSEELARILEKIWNERAGFGVTVQISYKEAETGKYEKEDERKIAMQVAAISARIKGSDEEGAGGQAPRRYGGNRKKRTVKRENGLPSGQGSGGGFKKQRGGSRQQASGGYSRQASAG